MVDLLDIAPAALAFEEIEIRPGKRWQVLGLGGDQWITLHARFPRLAGILFDAGGDPEALPPVDGVGVLRMQAALVAAGLGKPGDPDFEGLVPYRLTGDEQRRIIEIIVRLSLPGDVARPLLEAAAAAERQAAEPEADAHPVDRNSAAT